VITYLHRLLSPRILSVLFPAYMNLYDNNSNLQSAKVITFAQRIMGKKCVLCENFLLEEVL
jgi:hypothetical protein